MNFCANSGIETQQIPVLEETLSSLGIMLGWKWYLNLGQWSGRCCNAVAKSFRLHAMRRAQLYPQRMPSGHERSDWRLQSVHSKEQRDESDIVCLMTLILLKHLCQANWKRERQTLVKMTAKRTFETRIQPTRIGQQHKKRSIVMNASPGGW